MIEDIAHAPAEPRRAPPDPAMEAAPVDPSAEGARPQDQQSPSRDEDDEDDGDEARRSAGKRYWFNKLAMFFVALAMLVAAAVYASLAFVNQNYKFNGLLIHSAHMHQTGQMSSSEFAAYTANIAVAQEMVGLRFAAMYLSFAIVAAGCVMIVAGFQASYRLSVKLTRSKLTTLETSTPGLVMITLGAVLMAVAVLHETSAHLNYSVQTTESAPDTAEAQLSKQPKESP
jgi:hypothetical protein